MNEKNILGNEQLEESENICRIPMSPQEKSVDEPARMHEITWRIFRIMAEFVEGFQFLSQWHQEITIFGSARLPKGSKWYKEADKLARMLAKSGFTVITGGGPGIMEAANRGATESGGESLGLNIQLPTEQRINPYVKKSRAFHYFFTRKVMLAASAQAYVFFPGGFGTLDEFFEMITLIQTEKAQRIPVVCVGKEYWGPLDAFIRENLVTKFQTINKQDADIYTLVDSAKEAFELVKDSKERTFF